MKFEKTLMGDFGHGYKTGKHEFATVPQQQYIEVNGVKVSFSAESVYINGQEISNDNFQKLINIYAGRQQKAKRITKKVNEIKAVNPKKNMYDACDMAKRELNIR